MAFDDGLAERIREQLGEQPNISEKQMFGGLCFMLNGHMLVGIVGSSLMVRVGPQAYAQALASKGARPMDFTGKPMKGYVFIDSSGLAEDHDLTHWISLARRYVNTLPIKQALARKPAADRGRRRHPLD